MRSWYPIEPNMLDDKRLLGEHVELHTMASVIYNKKKGYANHPETNRWRGHTEFMKYRHDAIVNEMKKRDFKHKSEFKYYKKGEKAEPKLIEPLHIMLNKLVIKQNNTSFVGDFLEGKTPRLPKDCKSLVIGDIQGRSYKVE